MSRLLSNPLPLKRLRPTARSRPRIVASDVRGIAAAFDRYAQELYVYSRSRLAVPAEAAGVVQDTFLVAWSEVSRLRQPGRLRPWLFAVARNECHRRLRTGVQATPAGAMDDTAQLAAVTEQAELRAMVAAALAGLDPVEREISELNLRHGLGGADLAAILGVPARQAQALAARARAHLESSLRRSPTVGSAPQPSLAMLLGMLMVPALPNGMRHRIVAWRHRFLPGRGGPSRPGGRTGGAVRRGRVPGTAREAGDASLAGGSRVGGRRGRRGLGLARQRHVLRQLRLCL